MTGFTDTWTNLLRPVRDTFETSLRSGTARPGGSPTQPDSPASSPTCPAPPPAGASP
jgi:hypothetical protein